MADSREIKPPYTVQSHNFFESPPHTISAQCAATLFVISIPLDSLIGTAFYTTYTGHISKMQEKNEDGFPRHSLSESTEALEQMVCSKCLAIFETYATTSKSFSLQGYIQPSALHISIAKDASSQDGVIAKTIGDTHEGYSYGIGPEKVERVNTSATVKKFNASEIFVTSNAPIASLYQQVHTSTGQKFFFKPRLDMMVPEFDREISVLRSIADCGLHKTQRLSPFAGLVLLDNGLVAGMVFDWLEGSPLAEQNASQNRKFGRVWREQVETIVHELHRHGIVWGDVNVHNIFIDLDSNAWVIDFGGNCNVEFIDEAIKETYEGDRQGIRRVFEEWLPPRS